MYSYSVLQEVYLRLVVQMPGQLLFCDQLLILHLSCQSFLSHTAQVSDLEEPNPKLNLLLNYASLYARLVTGSIDLSVHQSL